MAKDIQLDADGDVLITNTGIQHTDEAEEQLLATLMFAQKGTVRFSPLTGVGIRRSVNADIGQAVISTIYQQLELDNWTDEEVSATGQNIYVIAKHK